MGRPKIEGNEKCPKCGKLGHSGSFSSRNGEYKNARNRQYLRFRHNDKAIRDCYGIEEAIRNKELEQIRNSGRPELGLAIYSTGEGIELVGKQLVIMGNMMKEHAIDPEDEKMLTSMMIEGGKKYLKILNFITEYTKIISKNQKTQEDYDKIKKYYEVIEKVDEQWWMENGEQFIKDPQKFTFQYLENFMKNDPLMYAINYWLEKYELPMRREKGRKLSSKLSESAFGSSKYNNSDFLINRSD